MKKYVAAGIAVFAAVVTGIVVLLTRKHMEEAKGLRNGAERKDAEFWKGACSE